MRGTAAGILGRCVPVKMMHQYTARDKIPSRTPNSRIPETGCIYHALLKTLTHTEVCIVNFNRPNQSISANKQKSMVRPPHMFAALARGWLAVAVCVVSADLAFCQGADTDSSSGTVVKAENRGVSARFTPMRGQWKPASFGGDGPVSIKKSESGDELIEMLAGDPITGILWEGDFPKENYEIRLEARRVEGFDFFAAVTFPVADEHCSFVLGGWGGGMVGISSIDGNDASSNETTQYKEFETNRWYKIRVRVDEMAVTCWLDDVEYAVVPRGEHELSIRIEMDPCLPLGIANFMTHSELRKIEMRKLNVQSGSTDPPVVEVNAESKKEQAN
ncbi:signal peptide protein [Rhodopirellula sp. SWK7]|nr:signal peptide protein [Rhodopirellula sp. SWK7]